MKYIKWILIIPLIGVFGFFTSCEEGNGIDSDLNGESTEDQDVFEFKSITYQVGDVFEEFVSEVVDSSGISNDASYPITSIVDPLAGIYDASRFSSEDDVIFVFADSLSVNIPSYINQDAVYLSSSKWKFSNQSILKPSLLSFSDTTVIEAKTKVGIRYTLIRKKYFTTFNLVYIDKSKQEEKVLRGTWTGIYSVSYHKDVFPQKID